MRTRISPVGIALLCTLVTGCPKRSPEKTEKKTAEKAEIPITVDAKPTTPAATAELGGHDAIAAAITQTIAKHGEPQRARIERGVAQVAALWRVSDGDLAAFCVDQFAPQPDALFARLEATLEQIDGNFQEMGRSIRWGTEVEHGPILPADRLLAAYDAGAHVTEDLFTSKVAFAALLNFPLTKLADRLRDGAKYDRRTWAELRLTGRYDTRVPGNLALAASAAEAATDQYVAGYNLWMHHVLGDDNQRRFPTKKRLISHWNLRDELKANYADKDGLPKQRTIAKVMERIVTQTIPQLAVNNARIDWNPFANTLVVAAAGTVEAEAPPESPLKLSTDPEPNTRYEQVLKHFHAATAIDKYSPFAPTRLDRAFEGAEIPEPRVRAMLVEILESPMAAAAAAEMVKRLGRPLEPHDIWYEFGGGTVAESELDAVTRKRYPTADAFAADLPRILRALGFAADRAKHLADHIAVDPSRGAGHAMEARRRGDKAHLRTRVEPGGMDYKGYNIAIHELGHNVEQTFSLYDIDHTLLAGVPNTAFTEALAFLFQARDLELLGRATPAAEVAQRDRLRVLDAFWNTREIAGSALVELDVWHWLYEHPKATAAELRDATVLIAQQTWDRYYAPTLGGKGTPILAIYSHTISTPLYLFNYVLGHLIAFQVEEHVAGKDSATFAKEFERVTRIGAILPDLWMQQATGKPVGTGPLLDATARALKTN